MFPKPLICVFRFRFVCPIPTRLVRKLRRTWNKCPGNRTETKRYCVDVGYSVRATISPRNPNSNPKEEKPRIRKWAILNRQIRNSDFASGETPAKLFSELQQPTRRHCAATVFGQQFRPVSANPRTSTKQQNDHLATVFGWQFRPGIRKRQQNNSAIVLSRRSTTQWCLRKTMVCFASLKNDK